MTRPTASTIDDDQLDALYTRLAELEAEVGRYQAAYHSALTRARGKASEVRVARIAARSA